MLSSEICVHLFAIFLLNRYVLLRELYNMAAIYGNVLPKLQTFLQQEILAAICIANFRGDFKKAL